MGRGIPAALLGRRNKTGAFANRYDAGAPIKEEPKVAAPAPAPEPEAPAAEPEAAAKPEVSMSNTKAELIAAAESLGLETAGKTKAQLLEAIEAA